MKKILIFSSYGGGGHTAVTKALTSYLSDEYEVVSANIFTQVLKSVDLIQSLTLGRRSGEDFYNYLLPRKWYRFLNTYYKLGSIYYKSRNKKVSALIKQFIQTHNPDIVVSVIPIINQSVLQATKELNLPFLLIPTDLDVTTFIQHINQPSYKDFKLALAFKDGEALQRVAENQISLDYVDTTGFVIRPDFFETKDIAKIRAEYHVPENKPVILLLLGAMGLQSVYTFTQELAKIKTPAHVIVCVGRQDALKEKILALQLPAHITLTVVGFTDRISDLMAISDLFITKSGSVSVCEALYMHLPMLLDATNKPLVWERTNHRFIKRHNLGEIIKKYNDISLQVDNILSNNLLTIYKKNFENLQKKHGGNEIKQLIQKMLKI